MSLQELVFLDLDLSRLQPPPRLHPFGTREFFFGKGVGVRLMVHFFYDVLDFGLLLVSIIPEVFEGHRIRQHQISDVLESSASGLLPDHRHDEGRHPFLTNQRG